MTSLAPEKCKKRTQYALNYSGTRFLSTENQVTQCPGGFRLNIFFRE